MLEGTENCSNGISLRQRGTPAGPRYPGGTCLKPFFPKFLIKKLSRPQLPLSRGTRLCTAFPGFGALPALEAGYR